MEHVKCVTSIFPIVTQQNVTTKVLHRNIYMWIIFQFVVGKRHCTGVILADRQLYRGPDMTPELDWIDDWKSHVDVEAYYEVIGPSWRYSVDGARSRDEHVHLGRKSKNKKK